MKIKTKLNPFAISVATALLTLASTSPALADLTNGLAAYWPLDNATGCNDQTPDLVHGYDMKVIFGAGNAAGPFLTNFNSNIYLTNNAHRGNAVYVDNTVGTTMALAFRSSNTNDLAPVNRSSPSSNTISFWINVSGTHPAPNNDQRAITESDYIRTYASVFDLSPVNNSYDIFVRQTPDAAGVAAGLGNFSGGAHFSGGATMADDTWHNVTIVTAPTSAGTNLAAVWNVYVDGVLDPALNGGTTNIIKADGRWKLDIVGLFSLVRNGSAGFLTQAAIDDVAEWTRVLSPTEILDYMANGITNLSGGVAPISISQFKPDLNAVIQGHQAVLSWQVSPSATSITIDKVGNVLPFTTCGVGSTTVTVSSNTTYTLTIQSGAQIVSNSITITTVSGVAPNWEYVGGFNDLPANQILASQGNWLSTFSTPISATLDPAIVLSTLGGNNVLGISGQGTLSMGNLGHISSTVGNSNTLFFRFYLRSSINDVLSTNVSDPNFNVIPDEDVSVGLTEINPFDVTSLTGTDRGPAVRIIRNTGGAGGPIDLQAQIGAQSSTGFSWISNVDPNGLQTNVIYNVWIDTYNTNNDATANVSQYFSVRVQIGGDSGTVTNLFDLQPADETSAHTETLDKAFIAMNKISDPGTNVVLLDDVYISTSGFNHTVPVAAGSFALGTPTAPSSININSASKSGNSIILNWTPTPAGSFTYSVLSTASLSSGSWTTNASGLTGTSYTNAISGSQLFFRVSSP